MLILSEPKTQVVDLCLVTTQSGHITVGLLGEDEYVEPKQEPGFWKRMFLMKERDKIEPFTETRKDRYHEDEEMSVIE